ncbi:uncharacterized protein LOC107219528 [Neodiprion lecontei]|uniref:Uncharacterized protein LOC107219528 n=1 Tax=Neodiprion lecontei TaxID=441921 RepID=A0A6J0BEF0_NEOLC|nr:uncharacterized protein LOC107219528 [Neodiprion lecontei]XP_046587728.1 uncharacterized protein LOC107219528 [Neodiprion lecontei]
MTARELSMVSKESMDTPIIILGSARRLRMLSASFTFAQLILGIICVGMALWDMKLNFAELLFASGVGLFKKISDRRTGILSSILKFTSRFSSAEYDRVTVDQLSGRILVIAITTFFVIATYIFLVWYAASLLNGIITRNTLVSEVVYQSTGFASHFIASSVLFAQIEDVGIEYYMNRMMMLYLSMMIMAIAMLYLLSFGLTLLLCRQVK